MDLDQFLEKDIVKFLDAHIEKKISNNVDREEEYGLYLTKDYLKEIEKALDSDELTKAKRLFDELKMTYNGLPKSSIERKKIYSMLEAMYSKIEAYVKLKGGSPITASPDLDGVLAASRKKDASHPATDGMPSALNAGTPGTSQTTIENVEKLNMHLEAPQLPSAKMILPATPAAEAVLSAAVVERIEPETQPTIDKDDTNKLYTDKDGIKDRIDTKTFPAASLPHHEDSKETASPATHDELIKEESRDVNAPAKVTPRVKEPVIFKVYKASTQVAVQPPARQKKVSKNDGTVAVSKPVATEPADARHGQKKQSSQDRTIGESKDVSNKLIFAADELSAVPVSSTPQEAVDASKKTNRSSIEDLYATGIYYMCQKNYMEASRIFEKLIEIRPKSKAAKIRLAECKEVMNNA